MLKKLLLALSVIALPSLAMAQTFAPDMPIIGGTSYCFSTVNGVCTRTIPAGPAVTGNETVPVDTNIGNSGVQSGKMGIRELGAGKLVVSVPLTGATVTVDAQTRQLIVNPAGTIAALTVNFPAAATTMYDSQRIGVCGTQIVTALTVGAGTGNTFGSTVTSQAMLVPVVTGAASCMEWIYNKTSDTAGVWYRTQ